MAEFSDVGAYQLKERIGRGGMAEVYRAEDPRTQRNVAVKIISADIAEEPTFLKRFAQEINLIAKLEHSGIVPLYDVGEAHGRPYLVMRYMPNGTLAERVEAGAIPLAEASHIITRVASALDFAHSHGIVHRDLKPGNILLDKEGEPYIADFGISKLVGQSTAHTLSRTGMTMGTPAYMSPEQFRGESSLDGRADVYALGVLLFQMVSGQLPFNADTPHGLMYHHLETPVPDIRTLHPEFPTDLSLVLQQALAKRREARYPTAGAFARDLQLVVEGKAVTPLPSTSAAQLLTVPLPARTPSAPVAETAAPKATPPVATAPKNNILPWLIGGVAILLLVGGAFLLPSLMGNNGSVVAGVAPTATVEAEPTEEAVVVIEPTEEIAPTEEVVVDIEPTQAADEPEAPIEGEEEINFAALVPSDADFIFYDDALQNGYEDWSWASVGIGNTSPVYQGLESIGVGTIESYDALWLVNPAEGVELSDYIALRFAIHGGNEGGQQLVVGLGSGEIFPDESRVFLNDYLPTGPVANTWREVTIPLADFNLGDEPITNVAIQSDIEEWQDDYYVDDIRLIAVP